MALDCSLVLVACWLATACSSADELWTLPTAEHERFADVQYQQNGDVQPFWQASQDLHHRAGSAGRATQGQQVHPRGRPWKDRVCPTALPHTAKAATRMSDDANSRSDTQRRQQARLPISARIVDGFVQDVDGPGGKRLVGLENLAPVHRRGDHQDRGRAMGHDLLGGGQAVHLGHDHVHGHHVRF